MNNNDVVSKVINKGVPINTPLRISIKMIYECCNNEDKLNQLIYYQFGELGRLTDSDKYKVQPAVPSEFQLYMDPETLQKKLCFSEDTILSLLEYNLGSKNIISRDYLYQFSKEEIPLKINKLRKIKKKGNLSKEDVLSRDFPMMYKLYLKEKQFFKEMQTLVNKIFTPGISREKLKEMVYECSGRLSEYGYRTPPSIDGLKKIVNSFSFNSFCERYADYFQFLFDNEQTICEKLQDNPISFNELDMDEEKLSLYLAFEFLAKISDDDTLDKQKYIYYLADYFSKTDRKNDNKTMLSLINDETITPAILYKEFTNILIKYPELRLVNFKDVDFSGMNESEVIEFLDEYLKVFKANWDIIPVGDIVKGLGDGKVNDPDMERRIEIFMEKQEFYSEFDPFMCVRGKKTFDGYIGYILSNGLVVLDKFFQNSKKGIVSKGDAIYCMNIEDFYRLSNYPKSVIRKDKNVICVEHRNGWQEKLSNIINQRDFTFNTRDEVDKLQKKELIKE